MKVFLAGEGPHELGGWAKEEAYRDQQPGILETLLRKVRADGWTVAGAVRWDKIRKLRVGVGSADTRNVHAAALQAGEAGCGVFAFSRDNDRDPERNAAICSGIDLAEHETPGLAIVGGVAVEQIESWVLSCSGQRRAESHTNAKAVAEKHFGGDAHLAGYLECIENADLDRLPDDAHSLRAWLDRARQVLQG